MFVYASTFIDRTFTSCSWGICLSREVSIVRDSHLLRCLLKVDVLPNRQIYVARGTAINNKNQPTATYVCPWRRET
ncbi:hypothetical protein Mapa_001453 [Marchantia paleacea]|nr:hypothetical protein Mapa_001453 [Marchantia paleacea]